MELMVDLKNRRDLSGIVPKIFRKLKKTSSDWRPLQSEFPRIRFMIDTWQGVWFQLVSPVQVRGWMIQNKVIPYQVVCLEELESTLP